jgi:hypothetical protein
MTLLVVLSAVLVSLARAERPPTLTNPFRTSGVVEGFFGPLYSLEARRSLLAFTARAGLNAYIYAPKEDPFHRARWREPYPVDTLAHFQELAALGTELGVRFVYALAPGIDYDPAAGDFAVLVQKLESIRAVGVRDFCIFFDDVFGAGAGADPEVQADIVSGAFAALRERDAGTSLCFISHFYEGTAAELERDGSRLARVYPGLSSSAAYAAYRRIPAEVPIMWTGPAVFTDRMSVEDAAAFREFVGRPVLLWDNYPVNDVALRDELFLGPYEGRGPGLHGPLDGILVNPMLQPEATKIPLWTVGRALALGTGYDPAAAEEEALRLVANRRARGRDPLAVLVSHFQSHPVIGTTGESTELAAAIERFFAARSAPSRHALRALFRRFAANHRRLERHLRASRGGMRGNPALLAELAEASTKLSLLGEAGLLALDLLRRAERGKPVDPASFTAKRAEADAIPWLVGANRMGTALATLIAQRPPRNEDVFAAFFDRVLAELAPGA